MKSLVWKNLIVTLSIFLALFLTLKNAFIHVEFRASESHNSLKVVDPFDAYRNADSIVLLNRNNSILGSINGTYNYEILSSNSKKLGPQTRFSKLTGIGSLKLDMDDTEVPKLLVFIEVGDGELHTRESHSIFGVDKNDHVLDIKSKLRVIDIDDFGFSLEITDEQKPSTQVDINLVSGERINTHSGKLPRHIYEKKEQMKPVSLTKFLSDLESFR